MQGSHTTMNPAPGSADGSPLAGRPLGAPGQSPELKVPSDLQPTAHRLRPARRPRRAFTLTELLVVIAIIGVLASLITAAVFQAMNAGKRARIVLEIKQMASAAENFKADYGAFPPNGMGGAPRIASDFQAMGKKISSRIHPQELIVLRALAGDTLVSTSVITSGALPGGLSADEAVYFWLGGFSQDPQFPISGPGGPSFDYDNGDEVMENRIRRYEFNLGQLGPRTDDGRFDDGDGRYLTYKIDRNADGDADDVGETRRINLWRYYPSGFENSFVYFDCSRYKPYVYDLQASPDLAVFPFKALRQGRAMAAVDQDIIFQEAPKYQILHCGLDDAWGDFNAISFAANNTGVITFPQGPFTGEIADTLTNFTDGAISDSAEE